MIYAERAAEEVNDEAWAINPFTILTVERRSSEAVALMEELHTCERCGTATRESAGQCAGCGERWRPKKQVRSLGWLQLLMGLFLVALMGTITYNLAPLMLQAGARENGARFTGTPAQAQLILGLFGLVIAFGLTSMLSGLWHIKTGRRNRWIFILMLGLVAVLGLVTWLVQESLGG